MSISNVNSDLSFSLPTSVTEINAPRDTQILEGGYDANNIILGGSNNKISDSRRCSILNGAGNFIDGHYNTHILGHFATPTDQYGNANYTVSKIKDDTFYMGCSAEVLGGCRVHGSLKVRANLLIENEIRSEGDIIAFASSDERLKTEIQEINDCLTKIQSIRSVRFNWSTAQKTHKGEDIGLIAQEVQKIAPEIVTERSDGYLAMKYEKMVPILVGAIQDQQKIIDEMRAEIDELKLKINH